MTKVDATLCLTFGVGMQKRDTVKKRPPMGRSGAASHTLQSNVLPAGVRFANTERSAALRALIPGFGGWVW
ncbi:hypothetical protein DSM107133_00455 [Pseudosulfitobacter sp. DSM 107133]|nr:hypothetical protein DSM107133_00455 [Pseudosulfitobacter sp. DSM 107133]